VTFLKKGQSKTLGKKGQSKTFGLGVCGKGKVSKNNLKYFRD